MVKAKGEVGKKAFLAAVEEAMDFLPVDWDRIDPENPAEIADDSFMPNETVVGEMTHGQKVIYSVLDNIRNKLMLAKDEMSEVQRFGPACELTKNILFVSISGTIPVAAASDSVGIKNDYRVVTFDAPSIPPILAMMFSR